jgi:hypothetical protein
VDAALQRVPYWNSGNVTVEPHFSKDHYLEPIGAASVRIGRHAEFTVFVNDSGKINEIEDVLEGGDEDNFQGIEEQADYFNLINEIRRPGSTSKGKTLVLYTARPTRDRRLYEGARTIPPNIFLSSRFDDAEGIAHDLGGNEVRDVWKVRIKSNHLVETLNIPGLRHHQVVGSRPAPVESIELISPGDPASRVARRYLMGRP